MQIPDSAVLREFLAVLNEGNVQFLKVDLPDGTKIKLVIDQPVVDTDAKGIVAEDSEDTDDVEGSKVGFSTVPQTPGIPTQYQKLAHKLRNFD